MCAKYEIGHIEADIWTWIANELAEANRLKRKQILIKLWGASMPEDMKKDFLSAMEDKS